jgi:hypothetical protein
MKITNLRIGTRLGMAFAALLLMLMGVAYVGWSSLASAKARIDLITQENNVKIALANNAESIECGGAIGAQLHPLHRPGIPATAIGADRERLQGL